MGIGTYDVDPVHKNFNTSVNLNNTRDTMQDEPKTMEEQIDDTVEGRRNRAKKRGFDAVEYGRIRSMLMGKSCHSNR